MGRKKKEEKPIEVVTAVEIDGLELPPDDSSEITPEMITEVITAVGYNNRATLKMGEVVGTVLDEEDAPRTPTSNLKVLEERIGHVEKLMESNSVALTSLLEFSAGDTKLLQSIEGKITTLDKAINLKITDFVEMLSGKLDLLAASVEKAKLTMSKALVELEKVPEPATNYTPGEPEAHKETAEVLKDRQECPFDEPTGTLTAKDSLAVVDPSLIVTLEQTVELIKKSQKPQELVKLSNFLVTNPKGRFCQVGFSSTSVVEDFFREEGYVTLVDGVEKVLGDKK